MTIIHSGNALRLKIGVGLLVEKLSTNGKKKKKKHIEVKPIRFCASLRF